MSEFDRLKVQKDIIEAQEQARQENFQHLAYEQGLKDGVELTKTRVDKIVAKLRRVADQCEAGGHKSRARMFRSLAKEFEGKRYL